MVCAPSANLAAFIIHRSGHRRQYPSIQYLDNYNSIGNRNRTTGMLITRKPSSIIGGSLPPPSYRSPSHPPRPTKTRLGKHQNLLQIRMNPTSNRSHQEQTGDLFVGRRRAACQVDIVQSTATPLPSERSTSDGYDGGC